MLGARWCESSPRFHVSASEALLQPRGWKYLLTDEQTQLSVDAQNYSQESSPRPCAAEAPAFSRQQPEPMSGSPALVPWLEDWAGPLRGREHLEKPRGGLGFPLSLVNLLVEPELGLVTCQAGPGGCTEWQYQPQTPGRRLGLWQWLSPHAAASSPCTEHRGGRWW